MKKILLASLVAMTLLLPALNNTSSAASSRIKQVVTCITGWVFFATSGTEDGQIMQISIYNLSTGEMVRSQQNDGGYESSISVKDLPHGAYSAVVQCQYITVTRQFKL